jgi:hypothetical protein
VPSLAWHSVRAWIWPARHLHADRSARMRASLGTVALAWSILAGLGLVFDQLTQQQGAVPPVFSYQGWKTPKPQMTWIASYTHLVTWSYWVFDAALALSVLAIVAGGLPLWLLMLRQAWRGHSLRHLALVLTPVLAPGAWLVFVGITATLLHSSGGVSPQWFLAIVMAGFAAATTAAAGPGIALRSLRPRGPAVIFASHAAGVGVASMCIAALASGTAAVTLYVFSTGPGNFSLPPGQALRAENGALVGGPYASTTTLVVYLALVAAAAAVAAISASRGTRAARAESDPGLLRP